MYKRLDLTGQRFNKLVVQKLHHIDKHTYWLCKCDCGTEKVYSGSEIKRGCVVSCGCYRKERGIKQGKSTKGLMKGKLSNRALPSGLAGRNIVYFRYRDNAKLRNIQFDLTIDDVDKIVKQSCYYCGSEPSMIDKSKYDKRNDSAYIHNGIDRVDNSRGYILENCVPCCKECNTKKNAVTLDIARKIVEFCDGRVN